MANYRVHYYKYQPVFGAERRYRLELPVEAAPRRYRTMTTDMRWWHGEVLSVSQGVLVAATRYGRIECKNIENLEVGSPCYVMEHLNLDGKIDFWATRNNVIQGNDNFENYGIPGGKHLRIDIYNGDFRIIE